MLGGKLLPASSGGPCSLPALSMLPRTCLLLSMLVAINVHTGCGGHKQFLDYTSVFKGHLRPCGPFFSLL